jgi:hypothetical protein
VHRADNLTTFMCQLSRNLGASTSWNPKGLSRPVMGLLYIYYLHLISVLLYKPGNSQITSLTSLFGSSVRGLNYGHWSDTECPNQQFHILGRRSTYNIRLLILDFMRFRYRRFEGAYCHRYLHMKAKRSFETSLTIYKSIGLSSQKTLNFISTAVRT